MDSAIRLCYSPLPTAPLRCCSGATGAATPGASRVHLSLSHGSLCLSHSSKGHRISRPLHVNCMLDRFSERPKNEEDDIKIVRGMTGVSLVLACVLGAFSLSSKMNPKSHVAYACWPWSSTPAETQKESSNAKVVASAPGTSPRFQEAPSRHDINTLKLDAMSVSYKNPSEAIKILENEWKRWNKNAESRHFLEMALIELLLIQGRYGDASRLLDSRIDELLGVKEPRKLSDEEKVNSLIESQYTLCMPEIFAYKALVDTAFKKDTAGTWLQGFVLKGSETSPFDIKR